MGIFRSDNLFFSCVEKICNLIVLSILWCICSITVIGIGPATAALYYAVVKTVRRERSYPAKEFFRALKDNWKKSILAELILLLFCIAMLFTDVPYLAGMLLKGQPPQVPLLLLFIVKVFLSAGIFLYIFPVFSRFEVETGKGFGFAVILLFRHGLSSILMLSILLATVFLAWQEPFFIILLPGVCAYLCSYPMEWILGKYLSPSEKEADASKDQWYLEK